MFQVILLFLFILCRFNVDCQNTDYVNTIPEVLLSDYENNSNFIKSTPLNHTLVHIVTKKYECKADIVNPEQEKLLLYGVRSWTFPEQDVHLTLSYPSVTNDSDYLITHVIVILYLDGDKSMGFIESGGILRNNIEMSFTVSNTSQLAYQFWLYGVHNTNIDLNVYLQHKLC